MTIPLLCVLIITKPSFLCLAVKDLEDLCIPGINAFPSVAFGSPNQITSFSLDTNPVNSPATWAVKLSQKRTKQSSFCTEDKSVFLHPFYTHFCVRPCVCLIVDINCEMIGCLLVVADELSLRKITASLGCSPVDLKQIYNVYCRLSKPLPG